MITAEFRLSLIQLRDIRVTRDLLEFLAAPLVGKTVKSLPAMQEIQVPKIPTLVFLPGECNGQRGLEGYSSLGHRDSDTGEQLTGS